MGCQIQSNRGRQCHDVVGGIRKIYLGLFSDFEGSVTTDESTGDTHSVTSLPTANLYSFTLDGSAGHATYTETITRALENGTTFYEQVLEAYFPKLQEADHANFRDIITSHLSVFVELNDKDANGKYKILYLGDEFGAYVNGSSIDSGTNLGDRSGYNISFRAVSPTPAHFLEAYTSTPFDNYTGITVDP